MEDGSLNTKTGHEAHLPHDYYTCKASHAFDQWFACLTVGRQLSSYYRYGKKSDCSKHWKKYKLCMQMKLRSEESGKALMREYREEENKQRMSQPNVLDVWTLRDKSKPINVSEELDHDESTF